MEGRGRGDGRDGGGGLGGQREMLSCIIANFHGVNTSPWTFQGTNGLTTSSQIPEYSAIDSREPERASSSTLLKIHD